MSEPNLDIQAEIKALEAILSVLAPLDEETRRRVLGYVEQRFRVAAAEVLSPPATTAVPPSAGSVETAARDASAAPAEVTDIRTLKEQKQPKSAVEMAVVVAYYVSEIAKPPERKSTISTADITKYFKQADYRLPSQPRVILHQGKNAGYLDSGARGQFSLNPVGYNLVTHGLPRTGATKRTSARRPRRAKPKPSAEKKATRAKPAAKKKPDARAKPKQTPKKR